MQFQQIYSKRVHTELSAHHCMQLHVNQVNRVLSLYGLSVKVGTTDTKVADDPNHWVIEFTNSLLEEHNQTDSENGKLFSMDNALNDLIVAILLNKATSEKEK